MDQVDNPNGQPNPSMPPEHTPQGRDQLPDWALEQARRDLFDVDDGATILVRAWEIVREAQQLDEERHDEFDDPDLGGEA